jgi:hypothetical protein
MNLVSLNATEMQEVGSKKAQKLLNQEKIALSIRPSKDFAVYALHRVLWPDRGSARGASHTPLNIYRLVALPMNRPTIKNNTVMPAPMAATMASF